MKWRPRHWRLRSQLALGIVGLACVIFLFIRHGSYLLDDHFFQAIVAGLPQKARAAYDAVNHFQMPDMDGLRELNELWPERMRVFQRQADIDLDVLFAVSCLLLMGAAYLVAMRLASPRLPTNCARRSPSFAAACRACATGCSDTHRPTSTG